MDWFDAYEAKAREFMKMTGTEFSYEFLRRGYYLLDNRRSDVNIYKITLKRGSYSFSFELGQCKRNEELGLPPTCFEVLMHLERRDPGTFSEFCRFYHYLPNSDLAKRIYKTVLEIWHHVSKMYNEQELEELRKIV